MNTGWWPTPVKYCVRCHRPGCSPLYSLCQDCRDHDLIMDDVTRILDERNETLCICLEYIVDNGSCPIHDERNDDE
jgi:hypothetical protein